MKKVKIKLNSRPHRYEINIGSDLTNDCGAWARKNLDADTRKIVVVSNPKVFALYGEKTVQALKSADFDVFVWLMKDGERYKNMRSLEELLKFFGEAKLKRTDAVIGLGGGVVGDLTGFAASIWLRGIAFLQMPTTLLSMIDSSVGGKTGINTEFGKNLVGAFHQPHGVLIDTTTLKTLPRRELTAGFCEAVKQGAVGDRKLFEQTAEFLQKFPVRKFSSLFSVSDFGRATEALIAAQVEFKARIVALDEREDIAKTDAQSRKILNFGHTVGHALEKITDYKYFKHGEAVGYGILAAAEISKRVANLVQDDLKWLNDVVSLTGTLPAADKLKPDEIIKALSFDKKNVGDSLQWVLLKEIGKPVIVKSVDIPQSIIKKSLQTSLKSL